MDRTVLIKMLHDGEGRRKKPYTDTVGKLTIGVGRNLADNGLRDSEIDFMLNNDIDAVVSDLDKRLPWWRTLSPNRQLVLADMCFNLGIVKLLGFVNTLKYMQNGDFVRAAAGMKASLWARQVKGRADKLIAMMEKG